MIASIKLNVVSTAGEGYIDTGVKIIIGVVKILFCGIGVVPAYIGTLLLEYKKITK